MLGTCRQHALPPPPPPSLSPLQKTPPPTPLIRLLSFSSTTTDPSSSILTGGTRRNAMAPQQLHGCARLGSHRIFFQLPGKWEEQPRPQCRHTHTHAHTHKRTHSQTRTRAAPVCVCRSKFIKSVIGPDKNCVTKQAQGRRGASWPGLQSEMHFILLVAFFKASSHDSPWDFCLGLFGSKGANLISAEEKNSQPRKGRRF